MKNSKYGSLIPVFLILLGFSLSSFFSPNEKLQIRIYSHLKVNHFQVTFKHSAFIIMADGNNINYINQINYVIIKKGDSLELKDNSKTIGVFKTINFKSDSVCEFKIKLLDPIRKIRTYLNNLTCKVYEGELQLINEVVLDNYIAGVTQAETGSKLSLEFYKTQAILARTFALAQLNKHSIDGFNLCDQVHCQAYHGKATDETIFKAIEKTKNKVIVDEDLNLIIAAFHSNSGGKTANSEDVWGSKTSYLKSVYDTFSIGMPNYKWERIMPLDDWITYLKIKHNYPVENLLALNAALNFTQNSRKNFIEYDNYKVILKNVRQDLQLKSTFFNIRKFGNDSIIFDGKGYGHGIGLSQEGAINMAKKGHSYLEILSFYFQKIEIIDLDKLNFFKDD